MAEKLKRWIVAATCVLVGTLVVSGCSSSSSSSSPKSPGGGGTTSGNGTGAAPKLAGSPIVVGTICSCSGAQAAALGKVSDVANAWASSVNASGGINGRPVKLIVKDDAGNPTTSLQEAKELVEQNHVVAIVGEVSVVDQSWASYVQGKGVPVVGGLSYEAPFASNPDFFPSGSSLPVSTVGVVQAVKAAGKQKLGTLYCAESPICAQLDPIDKLAVSIVGGVSYTSGKISGTAPNYNAPCLNLKQQGVDAAFLADNATVDVRVAANCAQLGYKPQQFTEVSTYSNTFLKDPNFDGAVLIGPNAPFTDTSLQATTEFIDALNKYAPGLTSSAQFSPTDAFAWNGGKLFEAAAKAAGGLSPTSTTADVLKGLYALKNETLGGLSGPLNFVKGKPTFPNCYFTSKISGGKLTSPNGTKPTCLSAAQTGQLGAGLAKLH